MRNDLLDQHRTLSQNSKCCIHCHILYSMPCLKEVLLHWIKKNGDPIKYHVMQGPAPGAQKTIQTCHLLEKTDTTFLALKCLNLLVQQM